MNYKSIYPFIFSFLALSIIFTSCQSSQKVVAKNEASKADQLDERSRIDFEQTFIEAAKEKMLGNNEKALSLFSNCILKSPSEPAPHYEKAQIYAQLGQIDKAFEFSKNAVDRDKNNYWYSLLYAKLAVELNKIEIAESVYKKLIEQKPYDVELRYDLAGIYLYNNKPKEALKELNNIEQSIGPTEEISIQKQKIYLKLGEIDKAAEEIQKLIDANPNEMKFYSILADTYMVNGKENEAMKVYEKMQQLSPNDPKVNIAMANFYRQKGNDEEALTHLNKAFSSTELDVDTKIKVLMEYFVASESNPKIKKEALALCKTLVETHPNDPKTHAMYGDYLYREKELDKASEQYFITISLDSSRYAIWNQLMVVESERGKSKSLQNVSERALNLFPNQSVAYFFAGLSSFQLKEYDKAIDYLSVGKDYVMDNKALKAQFYASLGDAYYETDKKDKAYKAYEESLKIEPSNVYVLNNYSYYLSLDKNNLEKAAEMAFLANKLAPNQSSFEDTYGWVLFQQGKYKEAEEWIEKAFKNGGENSGVIVEHLGDVAFKLGNVAKAVELWKKAKLMGETSNQIDKKIKEEQYFD